MFDQAIPTPLRTRLEMFDVAMLVTRTQGGALRARPMTVVDVAGDRVRFVSDADSGKILEIAENPSVLVSAQQSALYVSLGGRARLEADPTLLRELWSEAWRVWFPGGPETPGIVLVEVGFEQGEFWDHRAEKRLAYLWEAGKAYLNGEVLDTDALPEGAHGAAP